MTLIMKTKVLDLSLGHKSGHISYGCSLIFLSIFTVHVHQGEEQILQGICFIKALTHHIIPTSFGKKKVKYPACSNLTHI